MTKTVTHIEVPKEWESINDWDSHRPLLWLSLKNTAGLTIETGCGDGSTLLIDDYCNENKRMFVSFENNPNWARKYSKTTWYVDDYLIAIAECMDRHEIDNISLLFVDAAPAEIRKDIIRINSNALALVIHDAEIRAEYVYGMSEVLDSFKYRLNYAPEGKPHTTAVSNTINVCEWI